MKKIFLIFFIILVLVVGVIIWNHNNNKEKYEKIISDYMTDLASKEKETTCFYGVKYFGKNYEHVYAWVVEQCYYESENKIVIESGSSMAYRFYQEEDVIKYFENPEDGDEYEKSMEELFPVIVRNKMSNYSSNDVSKIFDQLDEKAQKYFNINEFTYESNVENISIGDITKINVEKGKIKKLITLNSRAVYGPKERVTLYDKNNEEHELYEALDNNIFNLRQIEDYLRIESENGNIKVEEIADGISSYKAEDYTII
ncbi:MAG: hypothetical protein K2G03_05775, partial [Bacilli bacterium]|nr:hypothetical protein [Bacilli bacterium]